MGEYAPSSERPQSAEQAPVRFENERPAEFSEQQRDDKLHEARQAVAAEKTITPAPALPITDDRPYLIDHNVKLHRMRQNLANIQSRLNPRDRALSRVVHNKTISRVSEAAGQTVSRPSGLLGGGIAAFIGSLAYLIASYRIGFTYNFSMFLVFFITGFVLGVSGEWLARRLRRHALK